MKFNLRQEVLRATEAWLASNTVGVPESIKNAAPQPSTAEALSCPFIEGVGQGEAAVAAPLSGPCIECKQETEDRHDNAWMCDGCAEQLNEEYDRDCRLDSPTHTPYGRRR